MCIYASVVLEKENIPVPRREKELKRKTVADPKAMRVELERTVSTAKSTTGMTSMEPSAAMFINPTVTPTMPTENRQTDQPTTRSDVSISRETGQHDGDAVMSASSGWSLVERRSTSKKRRPLQPL